MFVLQRLYRSLRRHVQQVSWLAMLGALVAHMLATWALLALAGEQKLVDLGAFPYYYMTTATTIGYGDLSPSSVPGRMIVGFFLMPGAVALFAAVLAKSGTSLAAFWRRHHMGKMSYAQMKGHTVLVGWRGSESTRLVELLLSDTATDDEGLVVVAQGVGENPAPERARFVATDAYTEREPYRRAGVDAATRIIVNAEGDDQTLAALFSVMSFKPVAHVVAHFDTASVAELVKAHYPTVECTRPMSAEVIARAAQDPGSSLITTELLCASDTGITQFSLKTPDHAELQAGALSAAMSRSGALLLGFKAPDSEHPRVNPPPATPVPPGSILYYLHGRRLSAGEVFASADK